MSRTRNAVTAAGFSYVQFALGIVTGFVLVPLILRYLGVRTFGLWLACGELIAYLALTDAGGYALAGAPAVPVAAAGLACTWRLARHAPDLMTDWPRPSARAVGDLFREGFGGWLGGVGYRLMAASNGLILAALGRPEWVPV